MTAPFRGPPDGPVPPFSRGGDVYGYVWWLISNIPKGKVSTYGDVARALGDIRAARAVGVALSRNPYAPHVPCHRVIMSNGELGGYALGQEKKRELLVSEGVPIVNEKVVDERLFWRSFPGGPGPLEAVAREQEEMGKSAITEDRTFSCEIGVDASYDGSSVGYERGVAAAVMKCGEELTQVTASGIVTSPYVPTYFHLREAPLIYLVLEKMARKLGRDVKSMFEDRDVVLVVDGDGYMHPRRFGLASSVGYALGVPSIGVAKSLLTGKVVNDKVIDEETGQVLGVIIKDGKRAYYVSSGNRVSAASSAEQLKGSYPEVLKRAHNLCTVEGHVHT
ncbi:endonuclease V [Tardisphaera miroshnichenkoae]